METTTSLGPDTIPIFSVTTAHSLLCSIDVYVDTRCQHSLQTCRSIQQRTLHHVTGWWCGCRHCARPTLLPFEGRPHTLTVRCSLNYNPTINQSLLLHYTSLLVTSMLFLLFTFRIIEARWSRVPGFGHSSTVILMITFFIAYLGWWGLSLFQ